MQTQYNVLIKLLITHLVVDLEWYIAEHPEPAFNLALIVDRLGNSVSNTLSKWTTGGHKLFGQDVYFADSLQYICDKGHVILQRVTVNMKLVQTVSMAICPCMELKLIVS